MHDCVLIGAVDSAGVCLGTIGEYRTANGLKAIGIGGATIAANSKGNLEVGAIVATFFNDMLWVGVKADTTDSHFTSLVHDAKATVGIVVSDAVRKLMK